MSESSNNSCTSQFILNYGWWNFFFHSFFVVYSDFLFFFFEINCRSYPFYFFLFYFYFLTISLCFFLTFFLLFFWIHDSLSIFRFVISKNVINVKCTINYLWQYKSNYCFVYYYELVVYYSWSYKSDCWFNNQ